MDYSAKLDELLKDGFTVKFATYYLDILQEEERNPVFDPKYVRWAHEKGFTAEFARVQGLTESNYKKYLSEYNFYKVWPLNSWSRIWVNDKLTLKYTLSSSEFEKYMPKYYFYSTYDGLKSLMDNQCEKSFADILREVKELACKPCNGTQSTGFFKLSYDNSCFYINDTKASEADIYSFINAHPNYVFTEYLHPDTKWSKYGSLIHTIRIITINEHGNDPRFAGNYIRIPHSGDGAANYILHDGTNNEEYNIYVSINMETGEYGNAIAQYPNGVKHLTYHPDTGALLSGIIDNINEIREASLNIAKWYSNLEFLGFDFGITTNGLKIMEINTHPAVMVCQFYDPLYLNEVNRCYFERKLNAIDNMTQEEKLKRNMIPR